MTYTINIIDMETNGKNHFPKKYKTVAAARKVAIKLMESLGAPVQIDLEADIYNQSKSSIYCTIVASKKYHSWLVIMPGGRKHRVKSNGELENL